MSDDFSWLLGPDPDSLLGAAQSEDQEIDNEMRDPFYDISVLLSRDLQFSDEVNLSDVENQNLDRVLRYSWLDTTFKQMRDMKNHPIERWSIEEISLLSKVSKLRPGPFSENLGSIVLTILGRVKPPLNEQFARAGASPQKYNTEQPFEGFGPCNIYPQLLLEKFFDTVQLPHVLLEFETKNFDGSSTKGLDFDGQFYEIHDEPTYKKPINGFDVTYKAVEGKLKKYIKGDCFWFNLEICPFCAGFGNDISFGIAKGPKISWINLIDKEIPPTLSVDFKPKMKWGTETHESDANTTQRDLCPLSNPNYLEAWKGFLDDMCVESDIYCLTNDSQILLHKGTKETKIHLIFPDPETGFLPSGALDQSLSIENPAVVQCTCNMKCRSLEKCGCCPLFHDSPPLCLVKFPEKGWGVVAMETIEKGQFITAHWGQYHREDLKEDGDVGSEEEQRYSFEPLKVMDACSISCLRLGGISRFVNMSHPSSDAGYEGEFSHPNVESFTVYEPEYNFPQIAFFALRRIHPGEELTLWYKLPSGIRCACHTCLAKRRLFN